MNTTDKVVELIRTRIAELDEEVGRLAAEQATLIETLNLLHPTTNGHHAPALGQASERTRDMIAMYQQGFTLQEIGDKYEITGERVRQIITRAGVKATDAYPARRKRKMVDWKCEQCGKEEQRDPERKKLRFCSQKCAAESRRKYTPENMIASLRKLAAKVGHTPGQSDTNDPDNDSPWHNDYVRVFGSMTNAQRAAGLSPNKLGKRPMPLPEGFEP